MLHHFGGNRALLDHRAVGGDVALQYGDAAVFAEGVFQPADDLAVRVGRGADPVGHGAENGLAVGVELTAARQLLHHGGNAAYLIQVGDKHLAGRVQLAQLRRVAADAVNIGNIELYAALIGDGGQVQHRVGGAAERHFGAEGVLKGFFRQNVARAQILAVQLQNSLTGGFRQLNAVGHHGRDAAVAGQGQADRLGKTVHGICRVHARARAAGGASGFFQRGQLSPVDFAGGEAAHSLEHLRKAEAHAVVQARQHGAAADKDAGQVQAAGGQQHTGHHLVAVRDKHDGIQRMRGEHHFNGVGDQLAGAQGILHALVVHRKPVADADGIELKRNTARVANSSLDRLTDVLEMTMARNIIAGGIDHRDKGAFHLIFRRVQQRAVRGTCGAFFH